MSVSPIMSAGSGISPIPSLGSLSLGSDSSTDPSSAASASGSGSSFSGMLSSAIGSLQDTQNTADSAAQGVALGTVSDPQTAVVDVENAQMAMQFASEIRDKTVASLQSLFQTQV